MEHRGSKRTRRHHDGRPGRYRATELPAGRYELKATRGGYVEVAYGQRRPFERGRSLELGEGAVLGDVDFALRQAQW